jgi:hypothetical protein
LVGVHNRRHQLAPLLIEVADHTGQLTSSVPASESSFDCA